ncbi:MAG: glycosyltransferase family 4 protein [Planctomycetaceae bacterium]|nr:glycosyltransferase family 4 protein [Planctomycetaceae bacterium]
MPTVWHVGGEDVSLRIPLLKQLRTRGFDVGAVGSEKPQAFDAAEIPYWHYPLHRGISPLADRRARARLRDLFAAHRPDVVHAFDTKPAILATLAARDARIPGRVRTITGMGYLFSTNAFPFRMLRPLYCRMQRRASSAAGVTVFQNRDDREYFRTRRMVSTDSDALIAGSGVDVDQLLASRPDTDTLSRLKSELNLDDRPIVTMIARLVRHKGVIEYLEAARQLTRGGVRAQFLLVGPLASEGRQAVPKSAIEAASDCVRWLGRRSDVVSLLALSSMFVLPSYYREGVPRVLLEAGALGLPLITTDMPGCRDVVTSGENGLLVEPRSSTALAEAIADLLADPVRRDRMGRAAQRRIAAGFDLRRVADEYAAVYERSLAPAA